MCLTSGTSSSQGSNTISLPKCENQRPKSQAKTSVIKAPYIKLDDGYTTTTLLRFGSGISRCATPSTFRTTSAGERSNYTKRTRSRYSTPTSPENKGSLTERSVESSSVFNKSSERPVCSSEYSSLYRQHSNRKYDYRDILRHLYEMWEPQVAKSHRPYVAYMASRDYIYEKEKEKYKYFNPSIVYERPPSMRTNNSRRSSMIPPAQQQIPRIKVCENVIEFSNHLSSKRRSSEMGL